MTTKDQAAAGQGPAIAFAARLQHPSDAAELRWYFKQGGLAIFQTSSFGHQLDRALALAYGCKECPRCEGNGLVPSKPNAWRKANARERELLAFVGIDPDEIRPPLADKLCPECDGRCWIPNKYKTHARAPLTAKPRWYNGGSKKGRTGGVEVAEASVARLGAITKRLALLMHYETMILDAYYSPSGGSLVALYAFTPAGKTLLRRNNQDLSPRQFFENEAAAEAAKSEPRRKALLAKSEEQSAELHAQAVDAWNASKRHVDEEKTRVAALRLLDGGA